MGTLKQRRLWICAGALALLSACVNILSLIVPAAGRGAALAAGTCSVLSLLAAGRAIWASRGLTRETGEGQPGSARLLTVQEEERKKLSRELHDGVGQIITAIKMELAHIKVTGEDIVRLQRARSHANDALRTIRNVSVLLRPAVLDDLGLKPALQWLIEDFSRRTSIRCQLKYSLKDDSSLSESVRMCVYRTVQEALNNCEKHAGAASVAVETKSEAGGIELSISDDGRGMSSPQESGLGILGMRERAAILGGRLEVVSAAGCGTRVTLVVPSASHAERSVVRA